jgi:phospholipase/carboxylesterase
MRRVPLVGAWVLAVLACERGGPPTSTAAEPAPRPAPHAREVAPEAARPEPTVPRALPSAAGLHYHEVLLAGAAADAPVPMIVAIHGLGDDPENFARIFDSFVEPARLILPRGVDPTEGGGWSWFPIRARSGDIEGLAAGIEASADKIAAALEELTETKPTAGRPIVTGFSQGGMLTFTLAVKHPGVVDVAVPVGGWLPPPLWPESLSADRYPQIFALHGTADTAVQFEPTRACVEHLQKLGMPVELHAYEGVQHVITPEIHRDLHDRLVDAVRANARLGDR